MTALLDVEGLSLHLDGRALVRDVSLSIGPGEVLGLVGPSGSGKSLTALSLLRLEPAGGRIAGRIGLMGQDLATLDERALCTVRGRRIAMVFQEPATALDPVMRVGDQVGEGLRLDGVSRRDTRAAVSVLLTRVGLEPGLAERRPHQLSGGQRQRIAIAAALARRPRLLVADEPTTALDALAQAGIVDLLRRLVREDALSVLLVSHDLALVARIADRVAVMDKGRIVGISFTAPPAPLRRGDGVRPTPAPAPQPDAPSRLEAIGLTRRHPASAGRPGGGVEDLSFSLEAGRTLAVVGESGAGKSTLLRALLGLERLDAGEVRIDGRRFCGAQGRAASPELRRRIQPVFQDPAGSFDPRWTVGQAVAEPLHLVRPRLSRSVQAQRVAVALERVGLAAEDAARPARAFSGGQRQRIALARALVAEPGVLVLDEATSALDVETRDKVLDLVDRLKADLGLACVIITHDMAVTRRTADRVLVLREGRMVEMGEADAIFSSPRDAYTRALLDAASES